MSSTQTSSRLPPETLGPLNLSLENSESVTIHEAELFSFGQWKSEKEVHVVF